MQSSQKYSSIVWRQFRRNNFATIALVFVLFMVFVALLAPFLANDKPILCRLNGKWYTPIITTSPDLKDVDFRTLRENAQAGDLIFMPPIQYGPTTYDLEAVLSPPTKKHILGTDGDGRDVAAQVIWGGRISLSVGLVAVGIALVIGLLLGSIAGFYGGIVDIVISRLIEVMICFPTFFLILTLLAFVGPSIYNIMIAIGLTGWTGVARLIRGEFLKLRRRDFVLAASVAGAGNLRIITRHILPSAIAPVLVSATFGIAGAILVESSLSFLGFGVPPSTPSWGSQLSQAQQYMDIGWWLTLVPGFAIFATITAYNLVGEAIRDAIDPNLKV